MTSAAATSFAVNTFRALRPVTRTTNNSSLRTILTRANATMSVTTADDFPKGVCVWCPRVATDLFSLCFFS